MRYAVKRVGSFAVTMLLVAVLTFAAFSVVSGDPAQRLLGTSATPERLAALREELGLNAPAPERFLKWLGGFFTGDLGVSFSYKQPVSELLGSKLPVTLTLTAMSFLLIVLFSFPLGLIPSGAGGRFIGGVRAAFNQLSMAAPPFVLGVGISWICGVVLRMFTPGAFPDPGTDPAGELRYLLFPAVSMAVPRVAMTVRMLRSGVESELHKDYVRAAAARGASGAFILRRHVLRNVLASSVTFLGQTMAEIVGAGVVIEQVFAVPGLGRLLISSVLTRDYPVVQAAVVLLAFWVCLAGAAADLVNRLADPRLRAEHKA